MTMRRPDHEVLARALAQLTDEIAWPIPSDRTPDLAARVRVAIVEREGIAAAGLDRPPPFEGAHRSRRFAARRPWPRVRAVALVLALVALLALAAAAGAAILGLPGLRLTLGEVGVPPPPVAQEPQPHAGTPGADLGLGMQVSLDEARRRTGRAVPVPARMAVGPPDAVYLDPTRANQVALVWATDETLPATTDPSIGLILMSFDGTIHEGFFEKAISSGSTIEPVDIDGGPGFWISGAPHVFFYRDPAGTFVDDERRWVGDALVWSDGLTTWRIESSLGRDPTVELAESLED